MDITWWTTSLPQEGTWGYVFITAGVGATVALLINKWGALLLKILIKPFTALYGALYRRIAPLNPLSLSVRSYSRHVRRSDLAFMEIPVGPGDLEVPLREAFAPLRVVSRYAGDEVDFFSFVAEHDRTLILGGPGSGKTTISKNLLMSILSNHCDKSLNKKIPVFVTLRDIASKKINIRDALIAAFDHHHFPGADKFIDAALENGRLVIILDGFDEVGKQHDFVSDKIQAFCKWDLQNKNPNHVIVTCREQSYTQTKPLAAVIPSELRIEPLTDDHIRRFLEGWPSISGKSALSVIPMIQEHPQIQLLCRNPLLLSILAGLYLLIDNFEIPRTRQRFFDESISELLERRPARRTQKQDFVSADKIRILAGVSLRSLVQKEEDQDPEKITHEAIICEARRTIGEKVNAKALIDELVTINSIIKPADEVSYTFTHRTFQEYLAAKEAYRTQDVAAAVKIFAARPELSTVLHLFCGLLSTIPQVNSVAHYFSTKRDWLQGGECLLNMVELPKNEYIDQIVTELHRDLEQATFSDTTELRKLEVLSALSLYSDPAFDVARRKFLMVLDRLSAEKTGPGQPAILQSLIARNPKAAERLLPKLVHSGPPLWRAAAVRGLRDIGSQKTLDELVWLLTGTPSPERKEAAKVIAELVDSRREEIARRAALVPEPEKGLSLWPLEKYFPGRIAVAIATAANGERTSNEAINLTGQAIEFSERSDLEARMFLKSWGGLGRSLRREAWRSKLGTCLLSCTWATLLVAINMYLFLLVYPGVSGKSVSIDYWPARAGFIDMANARGASQYAEGIVKELESKYPPNSSGVARILPWNWSVEPVLPSPPHDTAFEWLQLASKDISTSLVQGVNQSKLEEIGESLGILLDPKTAEGFRTHANRLLALEAEYNKYAVTIFGMPLLLVSAMIGMALSMSMSTSIFILIRKYVVPASSHQRKDTRDEPAAPMTQSEGRGESYNRMIIVPVVLITMTISTVIILVSSYSTGGFLVLGLLIPVFIIFGVYIVVHRLPWSYNKHLSAARGFM